MNTILKKPYRFKCFETEYEECNVPGAECTVLYIHGLASNPWSRKADAIKEESLQQGLNFRRYELIGHGSASEDFKACTFELWKEQLDDIIVNQIAGPVIIVGHCVGSWLGMCLAEKHPGHVIAFLSLAAAPNLVEQMLARSTAEQRQELDENDNITVHVEKYRYYFSKALWNSLAANNLLNHDEININCPIHLIHGQRDTFVDWHAALLLSEKIAYPKMITKLIKKADHHLQDKLSLNEIRRSLRDLCTQVVTSTAPFMTC